MHRMRQTGIALRTPQTRLRTVRHQSTGQTARKQNLKMISAVQANLRGGYTSLNMMKQTVRETNSEICIVSEHPPNVASRTGWYVSPDGSAAIALDPPPRLPPSHGSGTGFVCVKMGRTIIIGCYFRPNRSPQ